MRAWLLVLAVLATFHKVTEVASTEQVSSSSSSSQHRSTEHLTDSYSSSSSSSSTLDRSRRNTFIIDSSSSRSSSRNSDNNNSNNVNNINSHNNNSNDNRISEHITTTTTITTSDLREHHQSSSEKNEKENSVYNNNNNLNSKENEILNRNYNDDYDTNGQDDDDDINEVDYYEQYEDEEDQEKDQRRRPSPEQLVEIEKNLLSLFGFSKRPKIDRSKIVIPEAMRKLYQQITGHDLDAELNLPKRSSGAAGDLHLKNSNTVRSFTHEESEIDHRFKHHHRFRLYFNVSSIPSTDKLRIAELTLHRNAYTSEADRNLRHQVLVYDIVRPGVRGKREPILLLINSKSVKISGNGTLTVDITSAVERWLKVPKHNHGILVHVTSSHANESSVPEHKHIRLRRSIGDETHDQWHQKQPLLMAYSDDARHRQRPARDAMPNANNNNQPNRNRRTPGGRRRNKPMRNACQRWPLYVDFADVGWSDWIVAPPGYEAFYCAGECQFPIADHLNTTNHAIVQTLVNSISPSLVPKACCVPTHLSSICMLYLDDSNKVVLKNYQDMTVVGCGCR